LRPALNIHQQVEAIRSLYDCREVAWFRAEIVPLLPDIMEIPGTHPNPLAWFYRYHRQQFYTVVLAIEGQRSSQGGAGASPAK